MMPLRCFFWAAIMILSAVGCCGDSEDLVTRAQKKALDANLGARAREDSLLELGQLDSKAAERVAVKLLDEKSIDMRYCAVMFLREHGTSYAIPYLTKSLDDKDVFGEDRVIRQPEDGATASGDDGDPEDNEVPVIVSPIIGGEVVLITIGEIAHEAINKIKQRGK